MRPKISIIIPTLNEVNTLAQTIRHTRSAAGAAAADVEIIVADCGSSDGTQEIAVKFADHLLTGGQCRASAQNIGAGAARGDVLLFVHADSLLPQAFPELIGRRLRDRGCVGGAFDFEFAAEPNCQPFPVMCLRWVVLLNRIRFRWTSNFYGDQCIFVRRGIFEAMGGFPRVKLMEDIRFCRKLRRLGRTAIVRPPVLTSPRRFLSRGVIRQLLEDMLLLGYESLSACPSQRWEQYNGWNRRGGGGAASRDHPPLLQSPTMLKPESTKMFSPVTPLDRSLSR